MDDTYSKWRPHPWHGLSPGVEPPIRINAYIEITPFDLVKYEVDKVTGYMKVDRSQKTSSLPPTLYGFIPQTYASDRVAALMPGSKGGDHDPLDICVLSERPISRAEVIIRAKIVGGIPMIDDGQADDKLIGIVGDDPLFGHITDIAGVPEILVNRLLHYFTTYKLGSAPTGSVVVGKPYNRAHAEKVVNAALQDYRDHFPNSTDENQPG